MQVTILHDQGKGFGKQKISHQHACPLTPHRVSRSQSSPDESPINYVIMEQSSRMDEFNGAGQGNGPWSVITTKVSAEKQKDRTKPLPPAGNEVPTHRGNHGNLGEEVFG